MSESGTHWLHRQYRWLIPVAGLIVLVVLPALAFVIGSNLQRSSVGNYGPNNLAAAIPWILGVSALAIGFLGFVVLIAFQRRQERAVRIALQMTAELRQAQAEQRAVLARVQEAAKTKDDFLAVMSHELRTPLNGIIGMTTLLIESDLDAQSRDFAETARNCANGLLDVINDILDYSKLESGRIELDDLAFDPRDLVEEALQIVADKAQQKGIELVGDIDPQLGTRLRGDPSRLRQLLLNLVSNAVKFTDRGSVTVSMRSLDDRLPRTQVRLAVVDTGIGIAAADVPRLFTPFTQADGSISRRFGGTGLGLAICKSLTVAMGGSITASSTLGHGSTFQADVMLQREEPSSTSSLPPELARQVILLVDDDPTARSSITAILCECGCIVVGGANLAGAIASLGSSKADLAVLDAAAITDDPQAVAAELRRDSRFAELPLVLLTTFSTQIRLDLPRTSTVSKPVRRRHLREAMQQVLSQRHRPGTEAIVRRFAHLPVLVADQRLVTMRAIAGLLTDLGCKVDLAVDCDEACAAVRRATPVAVLLASDLPPQGAASAAAHLRSAGYDGLIIATGGSRHAPAGCDAAVTSPPRASELAKLLATIPA